MLVRNCKDTIKVGDRVITNGNGSKTRYSFEGVIGEIQSDRFFVWQNEIDGRAGNICPNVKGYTYSTQIKFANQTATIKVINRKTGVMSTINAFARRILDPKIKKLIKAGLMTNDLSPTDAGKEVLDSIALEEKIEKLGKVADEILQEQEKARK